jgi:hypothetical protein
MSFQAISKEVESHVFAAKLGISNNFRMFEQTARSEKAFSDLLKFLEHSKAGNQVLERIGELVREQTDVRFMNPADTALAVYLLALVEKQPTLSKLAAASIMNIPRIWWARKIALDLMTGSFSELRSPREASATINLASFPSAGHLPETGFSAGWKIFALKGGKENIVIKGARAELLTADGVLAPESFNTNAVTKATVLKSDKEFEVTGSENQ